MSQEKTEKATPKKRRDARKKGQVLKSTEISTSIGLLCMFCLLKLLSTFLGARFINLLQRYLGGEFMLDRDAFHYDQLFRFNTQLFIDAGLILAPIAFAALLVGLIVNYAQVGSIFSPEALKPKFDRLNPLQGLKRMFSTKALAELAKSVLKVAILGKIVYDEYVGRMASLPSLMTAHLPIAIATVTDAILMMAIKVCVAMLLVAFGDYIYQWWSYEKELRMSKQEIKDEYKQMEGDPQIKSRIRQKQRQMAMMRMMQSVPEADVVITNPTHYAVALKYTEGAMSAPEVVAKGKDLLALRIREIAAQNGVEIVEDRPVAQGLFFFCEIGDPIPESMYQAVAEILAVIFRARRSA